MLNPYGNSGEPYGKDPVKYSPQTAEACCWVRSHLQIFAPKSISLWYETSLYGLNKRIRWEKQSSCQGVSKWVCWFVAEGQRFHGEGVSKEKRMENVYMYSLIHHRPRARKRGVYAICSLLHSPGDFCLSPLRTWSPPGHGPCLVKAIRTRRGLSLKVIKKRTCWLGEKPAIRFLRATFFSCADCIQRSV